MWWALRPLEQSMGIAGGVNERARITRLQSIELLEVKSLRTLSTTHCANCGELLELRILDRHADPYEAWVHARKGGESCDWTDPWSKSAEPVVERWVLDD
jgi:hypothetical protein